MINNDLIKYENTNNIPHQPNLTDLSGTFNDIGQLIAYMRDLSRQLVPLVDSLVPLSDNLNDAIENLPEKLENFFNDNPVFAVSGILGIALISGYLGTSIIKNILEIKKGMK